MLMQVGRFDSGGRRALACLLVMTIARVGLSLLAVSFLACSQAKRAEPPKATPSTGADMARPLPNPLPAVVARVNGRPIALAEILPLAKLALTRLPEPEREKSLPSVLRTSLQSYVDRELLLQEALARGLSADRHAVDWAYDQARQRYPDDAAWTDFLARQGATPQSFRAELRAQQTIAALVEQELLMVPVSAEEVRAAYDANPLGFGPAGATTPPSFESVRGDVENALRLSKQGPVLAALAARLRARARVELLL
jgi:hypothetical protein